ncbi:MAG: ABC transporter permease [Treponema sp.]|nr:ABC transporter permease [Treponema sp.]
MKGRGAEPSIKTGAAFFIALRYRQGRAREGGRYHRGAATGIALSLVPIVVTLIVADGMIRGITDRYIELGTGHIQAYNYLDPGEIEDSIALAASVPGVRGVWPERRGIGVLIGKDGKNGATIRAVDSAFWEDEGSSRFLVTLEGESFPKTDRDVVLGEGLAAGIGAEVGSPVRIMTIRNTEDGRTIPRMTVFTVRGIVSSGYRVLDSLWCILNWEGGGRALPSEMSSSYLTVKIDDPYRDADRVARNLAFTLGPGFGVYTWANLQRSQYSSYESTRQLLLFIMALIVIVAAVNVSSATSMLVIERQRDIAVLKAAGASPKDTEKVFLWGSFLTGTAGAVTGIGAGLLLGRFINEAIRGLEKTLSFFSGLFRGGAVKLLDPGYYLETIPITIDWVMVFLIGLFTILCSVAASWIPARRAGRLKPLDLLRKY